MNDESMGTVPGTDFGMAVVSAPPDAAEEIARQVVERKLAACAQVSSPVSSTYWWKGRIESAPERLIVLKTRRSLVGRLEELLRQVHPYEVPELTFLPLAGCGKAYLAWLGEVLGAG